MTEEADTLIVRQEEAVLWLRINREKNGNTLDPDTRDELIQRLRDADIDRKVRAIVITGTGRHFCTGADIAAGRKKYEDAGVPMEAGKFPARNPLEYKQGVGGYQDLPRAIWELDTPVISMVNGTVAGAGLALCLSADLVVAAETAQFRSLFAEGGMMPHAGDPFILPRVFPFHRLMEFALLRERYSAQDMLDWNVINRVVPAEKLEETVREMATRVATGPTISLGQARAIYRRSIDTDMAAIMHDEILTLGAVAMTRDRQEGMYALMERRPTEFTGE